MTRRHSLLLPLLAIALLVVGMTQKASAASFYTNSTNDAGIQHSLKLRTQSAARLAARKAALAKRTKATIARRTAARRARASLVHPAAPARTRLHTQASLLSSPSAATGVILTPTEIYARVFDLVNAERAKVGLSPYMYNRILENSAALYAQEMEKQDCFSHNECGSTLKERMHASGYYQADGKRYAYSENIAKGQDSPEEVMEDWMGSLAHKEAILSTTYLEMGIGKSGEFWVQHFGAVR